MNLKNYISFFLCFLLLQLSANAEEISFRRASEEMLEGNPQIIQKQLDADIGRTRWQQSKGAYLPQLNFSQNWNRSDNPVFVFGSLLNQRRFTEANFAIDSLNVPEPLSDVSSKFDLGWLIYDFGKRERQVSVASGHYRIAELESRITKSALLQELVKRYFAISFATERAAAAKDVLKSALSRMEQATERVQQGIALEADRLSAQVFVSQQQQELIEAQNQRRLAVVSLQELLGYVSEKVLTTEPFVEPGWPLESVPYWIKEMEKNRAELELVAESKRLAEVSASIEKSDFLPSIQAWSGYEWHGDSFDYSGRNWGAGVQLNWNLFRGFSDARDVAAAKLAIDKAEQAQAQTRNALHLQLYSAFYSYHSAREKWNVAKDVVAQAEENRRIYAERYAAGLLTIQDTLQAEAAYSESRLLLAQNLLETHVAYAQLLAAAGRAEEIPDTFGRSQ